MTAVDLSNLVVEVLHNRSDDNRPDWSVGSGLFIGSRLVLTALHNVDGPGQVLVRVHGTEEHSAVVRLQGDQDIVDLAVLEVSDVAVDVPLFRYGVVDRSVPSLVLQCWAVGFPRFKERVHDPKSLRNSVQVDGEILTGENLNQPLLMLQVRRSPRPLPSSAVRESEWAGMSGATVFSGNNIIVGVISENHLPEGESALAVVPITALALLPQAEATKWWQLLGVTPPALVRLPSEAAASLSHEGQGKLESDAVEQNATSDIPIQTVDNVNPLPQALTQGKLESDAVEQNATSDIPIQTVDKDKLGFAIYVRAFRDFIASQDTSTPLTIGIYGTWGSGKSSLMHMIKNELDPSLDSSSKRWRRRLWWQWFRSYLRILPLWLSAKLQLWRDDRQGRAQNYRYTYANQPAIASSQFSAASNQGNQPNNTNNVGTNIANITAIQNSADRNQSGQANTVAANHADSAQNGHSNPSNTSASMNKGDAVSTQNGHDDSRILDKIGGPRRFQKIREDLSYTPSIPTRIEDATKLQKMRAGLSYDPSTTDKRLEDLTDPDERYWAKVAAAHSSMVPLTHPTIWFNAWKFDQEEQLWAALALEVMDQIKQKYGFLGRILFWVRLTWKRSSHFAAFWSIIWKFVLPIVLLVITVIYTIYMTSITNANASLHIYDFLGPFSPKGLYAPFMPWILLAGAILSCIPAVKIIKDPFQIPVKDILDKPNYKDKIGFLGNFEKDFSRIVSVATRRQFGWKPQKLVIFIDDLDRCEPPKAADIIEGINLFLDSDRCVFVLGMDPNAVAASIENKYKDLFEKMRRENTAVISPGRLFLDKIIQVPFNVPPATEDEITELMSSIMLPKVFLLQTAPIPPSNGNLTNPPEVIDQTVPITPPTPPEATQQSSPTPVTFPQIDRASYRRADIQLAINEGAKFLPENPRQVKKYMNLFRFYVYIADERGLLRYRKEGTDKPAVGLTLDRLAIWVAWTVRWAEIARPLSEGVQIDELRDYLLQISRVLKRGGLWCLMEEATRVNSSIFGHLTLIPMEEDQFNKNHTLVYEKLIQRINQTREAEKNAPSHWSHLPWEWWLLDIDFRKGIWEMQSFWQRPQNATEYDWLKIVLTMTRIPFGSRTDNSEK